MRKKSNLVRTATRGPDRPPIKPGWPVKIIAPRSDKATERAPASRWVTRNARQPSGVLLAQNDRDNAIGDLEGKQWAAAPGARAMLVRSIKKPSGTADTLSYWSQDKNGLQKAATGISENGPSSPRECQGGLRARCPAGPLRPKGAMRPADLQIALATSARWG